MRNKDELSSICHKVDTTVRAPARRNALERFAMPSCPCSGPTAVSHAERTTRSASKRSCTISEACRNPSSPARRSLNEHQSCSIWKCGICKPVNSEMNDAVFRQARGFEGGFSCRCSQQQLAFLLGNAACAIRTSSAEDGRSTNPLRLNPRVRPDLFIGLREYGTPPIARSALRSCCGWFCPVNR